MKALKNSFPQLETWNYFEAGPGHPRTKCYDPLIERLGKGDITTLFVNEDCDWRDICLGTPRTVKRFVLESDEDDMEIDRLKSEFKTLEVVPIGKMEDFLRDFYSQH